MATTFADAEAAMKAWVNAQTATLVGAGNPLPKGAVLERLRGAADVCYVLLGIAGGGTGMGAESPDMRARISGQIYGPSKGKAGAAAAAYADALLWGLNGRPYLVPGVATILVVDDIQGPLWIPDAGEPRYLVDCDVWLRP